MKQVIFRSFSIVASVAGCAAAHASDAKLLGCWHGIRTIQYSADGSGHEIAGSDCVLSIAETAMRSACIGKAGLWTYDYDYKLDEAGKYTATVKASSTRPDLIGSTRDYFYRVDRHHLFITTFPQTTTPSPPTMAVRVESESESVECKPGS
jgi:hypothetical protein